MKDRLPPGQTLTEKWPVLHYAEVPSINAESFAFTVSGKVDRPVTWTWKEFRSLPRVQRKTDFHCVTTWSKYDNTWEGVLFRTVAEQVGVQSDARHVMVHSSDGYYTNVSMDWLMDDDVLFAWSHDDKPLEPVHGGPLRLVVPKLYAWKSAKWVSGLEFMERDRRGFWEERGYHNRGEPFAEERYSYQETD